MDTGTLIARSKAAREVNRGVREALKHNLARAIGLSSKCRETLAEYVKLGTPPPAGTANLICNKISPPKKRPKRRSDRSSQLQARSNSGLRRPAPPAMHRKQVIGSNVVPFPGKRRHHPAPVGRGNTSPTAPLDDNPMTYAEVVSHLGESGPTSKQFSELHPSVISGDGLSRQAVATVPVTAGSPLGTICRMGRGKTPVQFNKELATRLKAARIAAGYDTQPPFAKALGVELERYKKWESGRTPIAHEYLPAACAITGKDANYFYGVRTQDLSLRRTGS